MSTNERKLGVIKVLVAGSGAVGKTTLVRTLQKGEPLAESDSVSAYHRTPFINLETIGVERIGGTGSKGVFLMVDVAGQLDAPIHALRDLSDIAIKGVDLVLLLFAADNLQSLLDLRDWASIVKSQYVENPSKSLRFVLIMNKSDLDRSIDPGLVEQFMKSEPLAEAYFEISCLDGQGVNNLKDWLVEYIATK